MIVVCSTIVSPSVRTMQSAGNAQLRRKTFLRIGNISLNAAQTPECDRRISHGLTSREVVLYIHPRR